MPYWDTSCLLKLYAPEADSATLRAHVVTRGSIRTSAIARFELLAALRRKESDGTLHVGKASQLLDAFDADVAAGLVSVRALDARVTAEFERVVEQCYRLSPPVALRALDAIHLATAFAIADLEMVATDNRLRTAAVSCGLTVFPRP